MKSVRNEKTTETPPERLPLSRHRLNDRLDTLSATANLHVTGPAGSGKTTLVRTFLKSKKTPALDIRITSERFDEEDLAAVLADQTSTVCQKIISFPLKKEEMVVENFFNNMFSSITNNIIILLDNYDRLRPDSRIHDIIKSGMDNNPGNIRFILISSKELPDTFIRNIAKSEISTIGYEDIKFTQKELEFIFPVLSDSGVKFKKIDSILDGWITGYMILESMISNKNIDIEKIDLLHLNEFHTYFNYEIFNSIPSDIQNFLKKICIPKKIDVTLATSLSGDKDSDNHLRFLARNNIFISRNLMDGGSYSLHPCFRSFLMEKLRKESSIEYFTQRVRNTSALLQYSGSGEEAYELLIQNRDWDGAMQILESGAEVIIENSGRKYFLEQLYRTPESERQDKSWINYWEAVCLQDSNIRKSIELQQKVLKNFELNSDPSGMYLSWSRLVESLIPMDSGTNLLEEMLKTYDRISKKYPEHPTQEVRERSILALMSILCLLHPESEEIDQNTPENFSPHTSNLMYIYRFLYGLRLMKKGHLEKSDMYISSLCQKSGQDTNQNPWSLLSVIQDELNARYGQSIEKAVHSGKQPKTFFELWSTIHKITAMISIGEVEDAASEIERLSEKTACNTFLKCLLYITKSKLSLSTHNTEQAELFIEIADDLSQKINIPFIHIEINILSSYIKHLHNKHTSSTSALLDAEKKSLKVKSIFFTYQTNMLRFYLTGDEKALTKACTIGSKFNFSDTIIKDKNYILKICTNALQSNKSNSHIHDLIKRHKILPKGPALHLENWPWPLKIYTLGRFSVVINGKTIKFSRRAQQKPLSMLKVIIALGGRKIREDLISDALWPDADGDIAHQSFATTLHRLRKLIGHHETIEVQNKLVSLNGQMCWVDSWVFERICGEADEAWSRNIKFQSEAAEVTRQGISLYHGAFLGSENWRPWILPLREKLQSKFIRCVKNIARYHESHNQWTEAITYYAKGLEVDNLSEDLYCGLMDCYQKVNLFSDAISTYHRCKKSLNSELDIDPSPKTRSLWQIIQNRSVNKTH